MKKARTPFLRGLTVQLFVTTVLPLTLLLLVIAFGSIYLHERDMRALVSDRDERAVQSAAAALESELHHRMATISSMVTYADGLGDFGFEQVFAASNDLTTDFDGGVAFLNPDGQLIATSDNDRFWGLVIQNIGRIQLASSTNPGGFQLPDFGGMGGGGGGGDMLGVGQGEGGGGGLGGLLGTAKSIPGMLSKLQDLIFGGTGSGGLGPLGAAEWSNVVNQLGPISDVSDLMAGGFFPATAAPAFTGTGAVPAGFAGYGIGEEAASGMLGAAAGEAGGTAGGAASGAGLGLGASLGALALPALAFAIGSSVTANKKRQRAKAQELARAYVAQGLGAARTPQDVGGVIGSIGQQYGEQWRYHQEVLNSLAEGLWPGTPGAGWERAMEATFGPGAGGKAGAAYPSLAVRQDVPGWGATEAARGVGPATGGGGIPDWAGYHGPSVELQQIFAGGQMPTQAQYMQAIRNWWGPAPDLSGQWQMDTGR